jgi:hypothetical protein
VELTDAGRVFVEEARSSLLHMERAVHFARTAHEGADNILTIGHSLDRRRSIVVTPREDLRDGKPLDASEFAVHLDQVRDGRAPAVYQNPERFLERTFLTKGLTGVAAEVLRRLSGA